MADANTGMDGRLDIAVHRATPSNIPDEVLDYLRSIGYDAVTLARDAFSTRLYAHHFRPAKTGDYIAGKHFGDESHPYVGQRHDLIDKRDLGPGLITNVAAQYIAQIANWMTAATPFALIDTFRYHGIGTGATAAAATDFSLQTPITSASLTGATNGGAIGYMTDTQTAPTPAAPSTFKSVATFTLNASLSITEWGLFMANGASFARTATGTPTATDFPDSGAAFTNTGNKLAGWSIEIAASAVNTPTTSVYGLVAVNAANSATNLHLSSAGWQTLAAAIASTPGVNGAYTVLPTMLDRKQFAVISGVASDTVAFSYSNATSSGT